MKTKSFTSLSFILFICATLAINSCSNEPNELPTASFTLPLENSSYFVGELIDFAIAVKDLDGTIAQVEILLNGTSIAILNSKPYLFSYEIKNIQPGDYNLEVVATDDQGGQRSDVRVIKVFPDPEEFTDSRDGNTYRYVTIGNQTWMIDNLAFLPDVSPSEEGSESIPHYYVYDYQGNDVTTAKQAEEYSKYGVLYNWEAAMQASPEGWHLPTDSEWQELYDYMENEVGVHLLHRSEGGTNHYGFSAILAGCREGPDDGYWIFGPSDPCFSRLGDETFWWSSSLENYWWTPDDGLSVRCIKD